MTYRFFPFIVTVTFKNRLQVRKERKDLPEDEDEEDKQCEEDGNVVHGAQHDHQLPAEIGHETNKFQDAQETESSQYRET